MTDRDALIALNMMESIGPVRVRSLKEVLGSYDAIMSADTRDLSSAPGVGLAIAKKLVDQRRTLDPVLEQGKAEQAGISIVTFADPEYPYLLKQIHDPPLVLYIKGKLCESDRRSIAMVGTRRPSAYGRSVADSLSFRLAQAGFTIVSGLARGIDTQSHRGALNGKGRTIAVLGGAIDKMYPPENAGLAEEIAGNGAVISEFPMGRSPDKTTFPMRNRIISGLSMGVVVVEAALASGALITGSQALDQGRSVFAVPGRIDSPGSKGPHSLIKNGACLVTGIDSILEELELLIPSSSLLNLNDTSVRSRTTLLPDETSLVKLLEDGELDADSLIRKSGLAAATVSSLLIGLEMKRIVRMLPGRRVELIRSI